MSKLYFIPWDGLIFAHYTHHSTFAASVRLFLDLNVWQVEKGLEYAAASKALTAARLFHTVDKKIDNCLVFQFSFLLCSIRSEIINCLVFQFSFLQCSIRSEMCSHYGVRWPPPSTGTQLNPCPRFSALLFLNIIMLCIFSFSCLLLAKLYFLHRIM